MYLVLIIAACMDGDTGMTTREQVLRVVVAADLNIATRSNST